MWMKSRRYLTTTRCTFNRLSSSLVPVSSRSSTSIGAELIPEQVVYELDKYIIGQSEAKKAVAIALRNRWRRLQLDDDALRAEIAPMNILMSGPTGSGKTEIARRLAAISQSPFLKVEATKFTEVGIYGANTESMIKDLVEVGVNMERARVQKLHAAQARSKAIDRLIDVILGKNASETARETLRNEIHNGKANHRRVRIALQPVTKKHKPLRSHDPSNMMEMPPELENMMSHLDSIMKNRFGSPKTSSQSNQPQEMTIAEALPKLEAEVSETLLNEDEIVQAALDNVQHNGIVFLDEIDKLAGSEHEKGGTFRKGDGVQKELLALTEGCAVHTRHGLVYTNHILFIASGAFHRCRPSDLLPELQGRLPIRVTLAPLGAIEFERILQETKHNVLDQMKALLATEGVELTFTDEAIHEMALIAAQVNAQTDDIGARRLTTIVNKILEEVSFHAPKMNQVLFTVDKTYVKQRLANIVDQVDLTKYIL